jgi:hypothetical protein
MKILNPFRFAKGAENPIDSSQTTFAKTAQSTNILNSNDEIILPESVDGKDRFIKIEKLTEETISPLVRREVSVDSITEIVDRNFSYPLTAHVGMKFDSRTFSSFPERAFDVRMKKVKIPSNYYPLGGNGLDRRYVYPSANYPANPNNLDIIFVVDQNMSFAYRSLIRRNLKEMIAKMTAGYTSVRAAIWKTASGVSYKYDLANNLSISNFTYHNSEEFMTVKTPDSAGANNQNLFTSLDTLLSGTTVTAAYGEVEVISYLIRKNLYAPSLEVGKDLESTAVSSLWTNTVRKVVFFGGDTPESMTEAAFDGLFRYATENCIQLYYFYGASSFSGTRTFRELADKVNGGAFNMMHDSDIDFEQFCDEKFYDSNKIYYGDWDGTFKLGWTDNPAWIIYDIATNTNYGLGNQIDFSSLDKWTLYDIGRYCDAVDDKGVFRGVPDGKGGLEPRYSYNVIFYNKDEAYNVLRDVAAVFKGIIYWNTEGFSFYADRPQDPVMQFSNANVRGGAFEYTETARNVRHTSVEVVYNDKYDSYKTKVEYIEDVDGIRKFGLNPFKINAAGCTSRSEARRIGRYVLCSSMFESDIVSFVGGMEAAYLQPGDIFAVSDEVKNVARTFGRILNVDDATNVISIDGEFKQGTASTIGLDSGIYIHVPSGNYSVSDLNSLTNSDGEFTGTLQNIRARRQQQLQRYNIHTVTDGVANDNSFGSRITLTGEFLLRSGIFETYPIEGRISGGGSITGDTILTGEVYVFPDNTTVTGNPRWETLNFAAVSGVLLENEIDIDVQGSAGTGQLIGNETNWSCIIDGTNGTVSVNGSQVGSAASNGFFTAIQLNSAGALVSQSSTTASLANVATFIDGATAGNVVVVVSNNAAVANNVTPPATFATYAATEIKNIGKDVSATSTSFGYLAALVKVSSGAGRIVERASKALSDFGKIRFNYRDLLALSRMSPYYTFINADVGNASNSNYDDWVAGRAYAIGNIVNVSGVIYSCKAAHTSSTLFATDSATYWTAGNATSYRTIGFPKDFYGSTKVPITTTLTSAHVSGAFDSLGISVYVGAGTLGQSDIRTLNESSGIGYSGLVYGTGYGRGFYSLAVDTTPTKINLIEEGSIYLLSGSGVEPKLYKTISVREEESNNYAVAGVEFYPEKENFVERDISDSSPNVYVSSPYDIVIKPQPPSGPVSAILRKDGSNVTTGIYVSWGASPSSPPLYKVYISRPDYSSSVEGSITDGVSTANLNYTVPVNSNWGQYDVSIYSQGAAPYKFLSEDAATVSAVALPLSTASIGGQPLDRVAITGFYLETADVDSLKYDITYSANFSGQGQGNFTSEDLTFRWFYVDPVGTKINSPDSLRNNPFLPDAPEITVSLVSDAGTVLETISGYQGFSYTLSREKNQEFSMRGTTSDAKTTNSPLNRNYKLRVVVKDVNNNLFTGSYDAYNVPASYSRIDVVDSYQFSPYFIYSGYYGNSTFTRVAVWNSGTDGIVSGSGIRDWQTASLLRSEDQDRELTFKDISGAFKLATGLNDAGVRTLQGININYSGLGEPSYEGYVNEWPDLLNAYESEVREGGTKTKEQWGREHWETYGYKEPRQLPRTKGNILGVSDFADIPTNQTGFSGIGVSVIYDEVSYNTIKFYCYSSTSNKDVLSVDIYTGSSGSFSPDTQTKQNLHAIYNVPGRSYLNIIELGGPSIERGQWYYFKFHPNDDFGTGVMSAAVSGYLENNVDDFVDNSYIEYVLDGKRPPTQADGSRPSIDATTSNLVVNRQYKIITVGTVNWTTIGAKAALAGVVFAYNGQAVTGSGGLVTLESSIDKSLTKDEMNKTIITTPISDSTIEVPSNPAIGDTITVINKPAFDRAADVYLVVRDGGEASEAPVVSVVKPNEQITLEFTTKGWVDLSGDTLYLDT